MIFIDLIKVSLLLAETGLDSSEHFTKAPKFGLEFMIAYGQSLVRSN